MATKTNLRETELLKPVKLYAKYSEDADAGKIYDLLSERSSIRFTYSRGDYIEKEQPKLADMTWYSIYPSRFKIIEKKFDEERNLALLNVKYGFKDRKLSSLYEYFILRFENNEWKILEKDTERLTLNRDYDFSYLSEDSVIDVEVAYDFFEPKMVYMVTLKGKHRRIHILNLLIDFHDHVILDAAFKSNTTRKAKKDIMGQTRLEFESSTFDILKEELIECEKNSDHHIMSLVNKIFGI